MRLQAILEGVGLVTLCSVLGNVLYDYVSTTNLAMFFLLGVIVAALRWGEGAAALVSLLSFAALDWAVLPPRFQFGAFDREYFITFAVFFVVGQVISHLAEKERKLATAAQRRESQTAALYAFSRDIAVTDEPTAVVEALKTRLSQSGVGQVEVVLSTDARSGWPLRAARGIIGRVVIEREPAADSRHLVESLCNQAGVALEQIRLAGEARQTQVLQATEKLQTALLNSISHDLRTPLASLSGSLDTLADPSAQLAEESRQVLLQLARDQANRLRRLVGNLLDMTRVEAGALRLNSKPADPADLIGATLELIHDSLGEHAIVLEVPPELPEVPVDFVLMVQVLSNLIDNATKYSPPTAPIEIAAVIKGDAHLALEVRDRGVGIPAEHRERIFDRFYRVESSADISPNPVRGTGLGLAISKGIVEIHGGTIQARNRPGGGSIFAIELPCATAPACSIAQ